MKLFGRKSDLLRGNLQDMEMFDIILCTLSLINFFRRQYAPLAIERIQNHYSQVDSDGRKYMLDNFSQAGKGEPRRFGNKTIAPPSGIRGNGNDQYQLLNMSNKTIDFALPPAGLGNSPGTLLIDNYEKIQRQSGSSVNMGPWEAIFI